MLRTILGSFKTRCCSIRLSNSTSLCDSNAVTFRNVVRTKNPWLRKLSTETSTNSPPPSVEVPCAASITPPFLIRVTLVGSTIGLATPIIAMGGIARLWVSSMAKWGEGGKFVRLLIGTLAGGGIVTITVQYVAPFLFNNPILVAPFAAANALMSMFWYTMGEAYLGLDALRFAVSLESLGPFLTSWVTRLFGISALSSTASAIALPVTGPAIGLLTAVTAPLLWPTFMSLLWSEELKDFILRGNLIWPLDLYLNLALPIGIPIGLISGFTLHHMLSPLILGKAGVSWQSRSLPALCGLILGSIAYFGPSHNSPMEDFLWVKRLNPITGVFMSYNIRTKEFHDGLEDHVNSVAKRAVLQTFHMIRDPLTMMGLRKPPPTEATASSLKPSPKSTNESRPASESAAIGSRFKTLKVDDEADVSESKSDIDTRRYSVLRGQANLENIDTYCSVFEMVDVLVRYKHLVEVLKISKKEKNAPRTKEIEKMIENHCSYAAESFGVKHLPELSTIVEDIIVLEKLTEKAKKKDKDSPAAYQRKALELRKIAAEKYAPSTLSELFKSTDCITLREKALTHVSLLLENLDFYESELESAIGYSVQEPHDRDHGRVGHQIAMATSQNSFAFWGSIAGASALLYFLLGGNRP